MDLNAAYQGDKDFWFLCHHGRIPDYWISKDKYADYQTFLSLFDIIYMNKPHVSDITLRASNGAVFFDVTDAAVQSLNRCDIVLKMIELNVSFLGPPWL